MQDFHEHFNAFCERAEQALPAQFIRETNITVCGRKAALYAHFDLEGERKLFGLMDTGNRTHCHESRCLFAMPSLSSSDIADWWRYAGDMERELSHPDAWHEFSLFSVVLVCSSIDKSTIRALHKCRQVIRYTSPQSGWSELRMAVLCLGDGKIYTSNAGAPLQTWLHEAQA